MTVLNVSLICILTVFTALMMKSFLPQLLPAIVICGAVSIGLVMLNSNVGIISYIRQTLENNGVNSEYIAIMLKCVGIGYITSTISDICRDCGIVSAANGIEIAGRISIAVLCLPLVVTLLTYIAK